MPSGSAAVYGARDFLLSGRGRFALVIGVEKMTGTPGKEVGEILLKASYQKEEADIPAGFRGRVWADRRDLFSTLW